MHKAKGDRLVGDDHPPVVLETFRDFVLRWVRTSSLMWRRCPERRTMSRTRAKKIIPQDGARRPGCPIGPDRWAVRTSPGVVAGRRDCNGQAMVHQNLAGKHMAGGGKHMKTKYLQFQRCPVPTFSRDASYHHSTGRVENADHSHLHRCDIGIVAGAANKLSEQNFPKQTGQRQISQRTKDEFPFASVNYRYRPEFPQVSCTIGEGWEARISRPNCLVLLDFPSYDHLPDRAARALLISHPRGGV